MDIQGLNKLTLLDYPSHMACTIFTSGCDFLCPFCHNSSLVLAPSLKSNYSEQTILEFLKKRQNILEGVCITGGEPTLQPDLANFIKEVKSLGFLVKLDTNGNHPAALEKLINEQLLDYIAMDIKNSLSQYEKTIGYSNFNANNIIASVELIKSCNLPYEFRTTVVKELHTKESFIEIGSWLSGASTYYLQAFKDSPDLIGTNLSSYDYNTLKHFKTILTPYFDYVGIRGVDEP